MHGATHLAAWLILAAMPWACLAWQESLRHTSAQSALWPVATLLGIAQISALAWLLPQRKFYRPTTTTRMPWWIVVTAALVALAFVAKGARHHARLMWFVPLHPMNSDMLPLIDMGMREFWRDHAFPYHYTWVGHWAIPLTYPPGLWLPFSWTRFAGVDLRAWSVVSLLCTTTSLIAWGVWHLRRDGLAATHRVAGFGCLALAPALYHAQPWLHFLPSLHVAAVWLAVVAWTAAQTGRSYLLAGLLLGSLGVARPYWAAAMPAVFAWSFHRWRAGDREAVIRVWIGAAIVGAIVMAPFLLHHPSAVLHGVISWYREGSDWLIANDPWIVHGFGLTGAMEKFGARAAMGPLALAGVLVVTVLGWRRAATDRGFVQLAAACLIPTLHLSIVPWFYTFPDALLIFLLLPPTSDADADNRTLSHDLASRRVGLRYALVLAPLIFSFGLVWWMMRRPPEHLREPAAGGSNLLRESRLHCHGFEIGGWHENLGTYPARIVDANVYLGLPVTDRSARSLVVGWAAESTVPPLTIAAFLNGEPVGTWTTTDAPNPVRFDIPRGNLFLGQAMIRLAVAGGDPKQSGLAIEMIELGDAVPFVFERR